MLNEKTRLEFLKNATLIRVVNAKLSRGEEGAVIASVELQNDSDINEAQPATRTAGHSAVQQCL